MTIQSSGEDEREGRGSLPVALVASLSGVAALALWALYAEASGPSIPVSPRDGMVFVILAAVTAGVTTALALRSLDATKRARTLIREADALLKSRLPRP